MGGQRALFQVMVIRDQLLGLIALGRRLRELTLSTLGSAGVAVLGCLVCISQAGVGWSAMAVFNAPA